MPESEIEHVATSPPELLLLVLLLMIALAIIVVFVTARSSDPEGTEL